MSDFIFDDYLSRYQSMSRRAGDVMWNQWLWLFAPYRLGIQIIDDILVGSNEPHSAGARPHPTAPDGPSSKTATPETSAKAAAGAEKEGQQPETLRDLALKRMHGGYAPPREIYDVRNRGQINWLDVPEWARPVDPDLFEVGHEG